MSILRRLFIKEPKHTEPECHHFNKTFKAHTEWKTIYGSCHIYPEISHVRDLYFECEDCGEILKRRQVKEEWGLKNYKHITAEDMPY